VRFFFPSEWVLNETVLLCVAVPPSSPAFFILEFLFPDPLAAPSAFFFLVFWDIFMCNSSVWKFFKALGAPLLFFFSDCPFPL